MTLYDLRMQLREPNVQFGLTIFAVIAWIVFVITR